MVTFLLATLAFARAFLMSRHDLAMETAALRQQLAVYKRKQPRPKLSQVDRLFWVVVRRIGTTGPQPSFSSSPTRYSRGIAPVSACSGDGDLARTEWDGPR